MTKAATKKTAGVLGDDPALNAQQVSGISAARELPVVWAVFKGSALNKLIMVPIALALSAFVPWIITPLLMLGGAFLCYEGFEKVAHKLLHPKAEDDQEHIDRLNAIADSEKDMVAFEQKRIRGAIRTDAILSAEIIVIVLGTVQSVDFLTRVAVLSVVAALITVVVYGLVAGIVKLDDAGLYLMNKNGDSSWPRFQRWAGTRILRAAPMLMKALSILGTAAMFLVGGGILVHGIPPVYDMLHFVEGYAGSLRVGGGIAAIVAAMAYNGIFGLAAGGVIVGAESILRKLLPGGQSAETH